MLLLALGLLGGSIATVWAIHQHRADVAALHRDPSYKYGNAVDLFGPPFNTASAARPACTEYFHAHPAAFKDFSIEIAIDGCIDEWNAAND